MAEMTLGDAIERLRIPRHPCCCIGGPLCCYERRVEALRLQRAAHIVAKLINDYRAATDA